MYFGYNFEIEKSLFFTEKRPTLETKGPAFIVEFGLFLTNKRTQNL